MFKGLQVLQEYRNKSGQKLYESGAVQQLDNNSFIVKSETSEETVYFVDKNNCCNCPDFRQRGRYLSCKHIVAVKVFMLK